MSLKFGLSTFWLTWVDALKYVEGQDGVKEFRRTMKYGLDRILKLSSEEK